MSAEHNGHEPVEAVFKLEVIRDEAVVGAADGAVQVSHHAAGVGGAEARLPRP